MEPFTRADLEFQRDAYALSKMREYVKDSVEKIYYGVRKVAVERSSHSFYYTVHEQNHVDVVTIVERIREELVELFPDFIIVIGIVNDGLNRSRYIYVKW
jgi:hypothetical protein